MKTERGACGLCALFVLGILMVAGPGCQERTGGRSDDLSALTRVSTGHSRRISSAAPTAGSNRDNRWVKPGETFVMADIEGPGQINHIWLTFSEAQPNWLSAEGAADPSEIVLRMYWDNAERPAVEAPLGDFFAAGFGQRAEIRSDPVQVESGDGYNCFWPMPFFKHARITITNESTKNLAALYYHVDYLADIALAEDTAYFCAQYRQEFPEQAGRDYLVADIEGRGHYVGTVISVRSRSPEWFGEGDDKFYIDGEARPAIWGTGTEDYFLCAWGMDECMFPMFGCTFMDGEFAEIGARYTMYRWHLADPVRFQRSMRFELEHTGWMSADETESGKVEGHVEREDDIASVAFWYQIGQPKRFTALPSATERKFPNLDVVIEGHTLQAGMTGVSPEYASLQVGGPWTGAGQIFIRNEGPEAGVAMQFMVPEGPRRALVLRLTHSYDYGRYQVTLDDRVIAEAIDLYSPTIEVRDHVLEALAVMPGTHTINLTCRGKNPDSQGYFLGVDSVRLRERWDRKRPALKP